MPLFWPVQLDTVFVDVVDIPDEHKQFSSSSSNFVYCAIRVVGYNFALPLQKHHKSTIVTILVCIVYDIILSQL